MFVNILTADEKHSLLNLDDLTQPIQMQLSQKQKTFSEFPSALMKSRLSFEYFQKRMSLITDVFLKLQTPRNMVK